MRWIERIIENPARVQTLSKALNSLPEPLTRFLVLRGIDTVEAARQYFRGTREDLHDPGLLAEINQAADRIAKAIQTKERVLVYGDFDADGVTSTALVLQFLNSRGIEAASYIPHRQKENHGFHATGVQVAKEQKCSLIIVVDCGTNAVESATCAKEEGIDLIICDHHQNEDKIPICTAHVNPNREGCSYPQKEVSACALAYKIVLATLEVLGESVQLADQYLGLVAISTICDIMPLTGENRIMVHEGLNVLRMTDHPGLRALISSSGCNQNHLTSLNISMSMGPRLNAAGRLAHADEALNLLMSTSKTEAVRLAKRLNDLNQNRKKLGAQLRPVARKLARTQLAGTHTDALVLYHPDWHPGILGWMASQIVQEFSLPTVLLTDVPGSSGEELFGSVRSFGEIDVFRALTDCGDLLIRFGGHAQAAGVTLKREDYPPFKVQLNQEVANQGRDQVMDLTLEYDARLRMDQISGKFTRVLNICQPFGKANEAPVFLMENLQPVSVRQITDGQHLKMNLRDPKSTIVMDSIGFGLGKQYSMAEEARTKKTGLDLLCRVEENRWNGTVTTQLRIEALRAHTSS